MESAREQEQRSYPAQAALGGGAAEGEVGVFLRQILYLFSFLLNNNNK